MHRRSQRDLLCNTAGGPGPVVELDGSQAGAVAGGLWIRGGSSRVRGLAINRFARDGVHVDTLGNNVVEGNYIGIDVTGTSDPGNSEVGVYLATSNNTVGGTMPGTRNVISGNGSVGVYVPNNGSGNRIEGNYMRPGHNSDQTGSGLATVFARRRRRELRGPRGTLVFLVRRPAIYDRVSYS